MIKLMNKDLGQKEKIRHIIPISTTYNLKYFLPHQKKDQAKKKRRRKRFLRGRRGE